MSPQHIGQIWARTVSGVIGADGGIPWRIPEDTAHFKAVTADHPVIMGRKTWDSLPQKFRPLPGRRNIVVTRDSEFSPTGADTAPSVADAIALVDGDTAWVIGGGEIYRAAMPLATMLEVTEVDLEVDGDTRAPDISGDWVITQGEWQTSRVGDTRFRFLRYGKPYQTS